MRNYILAAIVETCYIK